MLKTYLRMEGAGGTSDFWEKAWADGSLAAAMRFCDADPLSDLFQRYLPPGGTVLEGGCGLGQYVAYYGDRGYRLVGLDFTERPLLSLKRERPASRLCRGDVAHLPFSDASFDAYYSGGVVEHFEDGPERALREARRVLKPNGVLLISVPYVNGIRQTRNLLGWKTPGVATREISKLGVDTAPPDHVFFQYVFGRAEFARYLDDAGFDVIEMRGTHFLWGLKEIEPLRRLLERRAPVHAANVATSDASVAEAREGALRRYLRRVLLEEDARGFPAIGILRSLAANMMVYVCKPRP